MDYKAAVEIIKRVLQENNLLSDKYPYGSN